MWKKRLWRVFIPLFMMVLLCGIQTVIWPSLTTTIEAPPLWLLLIIWICIYREERETILLVYVMGWIATAFTAMPLKMMLFSLLFLYLLLRRIKERIFWTGLPYFALMSLAATTAFQVFYIVLSVFLEPTRVAWLPLERLTLILWTPPTAALVYTLMMKVDRPTSLEHGRHDGSYV